MMVIPCRLRWRKSFVLELALLRSKHASMEARRDRLRRDLTRISALVHRVRFSREGNGGSEGNEGVAYDNNAVKTISKIEIYNEGTRGSRFVAFATSVAFA
jgi:hypothetical protein